LTERSSIGPTGFARVTFADSGTNPATKFPFGSVRTRSSLVSQAATPTSADTLRDDCLLRASRRHRPAAVQNRSKIAGSRAARPRPCAVARRSQSARHRAAERSKSTATVTGRRPPVGRDIRAARRQRHGAFDPRIRSSPAVVTGRPSEAPDRRKVAVARYRAALAAVGGTRTNDISEDELRPETVSI
jgi:hypothetical protein